ncbi:MAG: hypothetical protein PHG66_01100 [Candidatus Colwellbacteria bacterium]|nr:hypothetical protein [Candidatus Colwellbacteria bacterium]
MSSSVIRQSRQHQLPSLSERISTKRLVSDFLESVNPDKNEMVNVLVRIMEKKDLPPMTRRRIRISTLDISQKNSRVSRSMVDEESRRPFFSNEGTILKFLQDESTKQCVTVSPDEKIPLLVL